jgi:hypothetical protein
MCEAIRLLAHAALLSDNGGAAEKSQPSSSFLNETFKLGARLRPPLLRNRAGVHQLADFARAIGRHQF